MANDAQRRGETILVLQGGGALGAYQAGVFQGLDGAGLRPDWVAGISIGAVNAALIAGNPPGEQVGRLRAFWELISSDVPWFPPVALPLASQVGAQLSLPLFDPGALNEASATRALLYVLDQPDRTDREVFQVDLFPARGELPRTLDEVGEREKDIRYSSRIRLNTIWQLDRQTIARTAERLIAKLPPSLRDDPDAQALAALHPSCASLDVVHLIYRTRHEETNSKDYEFSRRTMETHWSSGEADMAVTLGDPRWQARRRSGMHVLDLVPPTPADAMVAPHERRRPEMQGFRAAA